MRCCAGVFSFGPLCLERHHARTKKANEHTRRHSLHTRIKHIQRYHNINWINQIFSTITNVLRTKLSYRYNTSYLPLFFFLFYPLAHSPCRDGPGVDHVVHRPADGTRIRAAIGSASSASCEPEPFPPRSFSSARRVSSFFRTVLHGHVGKGERHIVRRCTS